MWTIIVCTVVYVVISLLGTTRFNMEELLHRGIYAVASDQTHVRHKTSWIQRLFGIDQEFTRADRLLAFAIVGWFLTWLGVFLVGTAYAVVFSPGEDVWAQFWWVYLWILFALALVVTVWLSWGGIRDTLWLFHQLRTQERDYSDDGMIRKDGTIPKGGEGAPPETRTV